MQDALALDDRHLQLSWDSLSRVGNLSSASVLLVLEDNVKNHRLRALAAQPGSFAGLLAVHVGAKPPMTAWLDALLLALNMISNAATTRAAADATR